MQRRVKGERFKTRRKKVEKKKRKKRTYLSLRISVISCPVRLHIDELHFQATQGRTKVIVLGAARFILAPVIVNIRLGDRASHGCSGERIDDARVAVDA